MPMQKIEDAQFSVRALNALRAYFPHLEGPKICTAPMSILDQIVDEEFLRIDNVGRKTLNEIKMFQGMGPSGAGGILTRLRSINRDITEIRQQVYHINQMLAHMNGSHNTGRGEIVEMLSRISGQLASIVDNPRR